MSSDNLTFKDFLKVMGCLGIGVISVVLGLIAMFYIAGVLEQRWVAAKPKNLTDKQWDAKRERCDTISLEPQECAEISSTELDKRNDAKAKELAEKLCAEDVTFKAKVEGKEVVKAHLRSPSTARFINSEITATQKGCTWTVVGQVDAQNGFGAQIRSPFRVVLQRIGEDVWVATSVRVD